MAALLPVDEALERLLSGARTVGSETIPIADAAGRMLAAPVTALRTQPPFDASAMDGYAVRAEDIAALPAILTVIAESAAGSRHPGAVGPGEAVRIFTGAPVPKGADTILLQEDSRKAGDRTIEATESTERGRHIRRAGLDFREGDLLLPFGRVLDPAALSLAAAANHASVTVVRRPLVAVLATGSELVAPGEQRGPDQIVASNSYAIAAIARSCGARVLDLGIVPDDHALMSAAIGRARSAGAEVIVTLGGASVGDHDIVRPVLEAMGMRLDFWKIAMRPGKPLMFGRLDEARVLGLPGNPVSSFVCAHLFLKPLLCALAGFEWTDQTRPAVLGAAMKANEHRQDYVRATLDVKDGQIVATPFQSQDSSMLRTLAESDALIIRPPHAPPAQMGDPCRILQLR